MKKILLLVTIFLFCAEFVISQDTTTINNIEKNYLQNDWNWAIEVPIWIPGFRGDFAYGDISLEGEDGIDPGTPGHPIEPPPPGEPPDDDGDILSRLFSSTRYLKFFLVGRVSYKMDKFLAQIDGFTGSVGNSVDFKLNNKEVATASYATILTRLLIGYSIYELENRSQTNRLTIYGYTGMRAHYFEIFSNLNLTTRNLDINVFWGEAILGIQTIFALKDWLFWLQADIGSFYTSSHSSYMISALCHYRISNLISVKIGWTDWDVSYKGEVLRETLTLDVHFSGPSTGLTFHF